MSCITTAEAFARNDEIAVAWYRRAAELGEDTAQYNLGYMYTHGYGVPQDLVHAYMWFTLARAAGNDAAAFALNEIAVHMYADDIAEAERLAGDWADAHQ